MVEAFLASIGEDWDETRVEYAIRQHEQWYKGDGAYGDGAFFHRDDYNSSVIQPMPVDILRAIRVRTGRFAAFATAVQKRAARCADVLERLIAPDGSFPVIGRSMAYRSVLVRPDSRLDSRRGWRVWTPGPTTPSTMWRTSRCAYGSATGRRGRAAGLP